MNRFFREQEIEQNNLWNQDLDLRAEDNFRNNREENHLYREAVDYMA